MARIALQTALLLFTVQSAASWLPLASGVTARLRGVSASSEKVIWASGSNSTVLRSTDAGATWEQLPAPSPDRLDYRDIDAISDDVAYVLSIGNGPASRIFKTVDAGKTWALQFKNDDANAFYDAMSFSDPDHGVAVSDSVDGKFVVLTTADGGKTWTRVPADWMPPALPNEGAFAASGTNVTARGDRIWIATGAAARARVLRSFDRGRSWQVADTPVASSGSAGICSIAFRDDLHGVVVGGDISKDSVAGDNVAFTSNGGVTWTLAHGLGGFRSVVAPVPGKATSWLAVGPLGSDLSEDDGRTWHPVAGPGYDTLTFAPAQATGWGAGASGAVGRVTVK